MTDPPCASCGRMVRLRGISPQGRICSNCCARRRSGVCECCGKVARFDGRHPDGRRWCQRCARRHQAAATVADNRARSITAVSALEPHLSVAVIEAAVRHAASAARNVRLLAEHLAAHPDALTAGPSSTVPVLRRLAEALQEAGARHISVRHPACATGPGPGTPTGLARRRRRPTLRPAPPGQPARRGTRHPHRRTRRRRSTRRSGVAALACAGPAPPLRRRRP